VLPLLVQTGLRAHHLKVLEVLAHFRSQELELRRRRQQLEVVVVPGHGRDSRECPVSYVSKNSHIIRTQGADMKNVICARGACWHSRHRNGKRRDRIFHVRSGGIPRHGQGCCKRLA
jgi:hypothetical protein